MDTTALLQEGLIPTPGKRNRRPGLHALTGLRFFAALYVLMFHFGAGFADRAHMPHWLVTFLQRGNLGVALFLTLSGFILYYTYYGNLESGRDIYKFFIARAARIYPIYLLAIAFEGVLFSKLPHGQELLIFPMLQAWAPAVSPSGYAWIMQAWTISVEAFFYCSFPLLMFIFRNVRSRQALYGIAILAALVAIFLQSPFAHPGMEDSWKTRHLLLPLLCIPEFILGMALGAIYLKKHTQDPSSFSSDWITVAGALPCVAAIAFGVGEFPASVAAVFWFSWIIYRLADGRGWLTSLLSSRFVMLLGGASFSIYLLQGPMRTLIRNLFASWHPGLDAAITPIVLTLFSCLLFLFYEEPLRDIIRKTLSTGSKTAPSAAVSAEKSAS